MKNKIRALLLLLCATLSTGLTSCTDMNEELIVGTWNVVSKTYTVTNHPIDSLNRSEVEPVGADSPILFFFNKDKTGGIKSSTTDSSPETFTYTLSGDILVITFDNAKRTKSDDIVRLVIETINEKDLRLSRTETNYYHEGRPDEQEFTAKLTLKMKKV